ncbi:MAG: ubiquinone biosynthesis protein [Bacteroidota bacterium]|nr:ubiquinone biosynthesis protein [Bacteroidota bacterium]
MKKIKVFFRLIYIQYVWISNGLDDILTSHRQLSMFRFLIYFNPWFWIRQKQEPAVAIRQTLETLGPLFVKFGQALSTRPDILPSDIAHELSKLQDKVPPFASEKVLEILNKAYGKPIHEVFLEFDIEPLASASMAQVHRARLYSGEDVVVKILRPKIRETIEHDIEILKYLAYWAEKYIPHAKKLKPREVVSEFEHNLLDELDLHREAANAAQLKRNFNQSHLLYVPDVYWDYIRENILVMERINGIPVNNIEQLKKHHINLKLLAERGLIIFFTQVFRDCFFHADMHPGNIFVSREHPENPQYLCVDFGIVGTLNERDKYYLAENLLAFFNRDYQRVADLHIASGWVAKDTRAEDFASAIRTVCEPIFEKPLKDISFAQLMMRLFQVARRFHMEVQPQLVLLQKTLLAVEGLGRQIYPDLDLWQTGKPFLEKWVKEQVGIKALIKHCKANIPFFVEQLPYMPRLMNDVLMLNKEQYELSLKCFSEYKTPVAKKSHFFKRCGIILLFGVGAILGYYLRDIIDEQYFLAFIMGLTVSSGLLLLTH